MSKVAGRRVAVTDEPTRLDTVEGSHAGGQSMLIKNPSVSAGDVCVGDADVEFDGDATSTDGGFLLEQGEAIGPELLEYDEEGVYAIADTGDTVVLHIFETGV